MALIRLTDNIITITEPGSRKQPLKIHYVMVSGAYDASMIGPFLSYQYAVDWCAVPEHQGFDATVFTQQQMELNIREYADIYLYTPP